MTESPRPRATRSVIFDLEPFEHSVRARKFAHILRELGDVDFIGLERAGRLGIRGRRGTWLDEEGVRIRSARMPPLQQSGSTTASLRNTASYLVGLLPSTLRLLRTRADVVVCGNPALLMPCAVHRAIHQSVLVFDARERPASVRMKGSLAAVLSRVEPLIFSLVGSRIDLAFSVAPSHIREYQEIGVNRVELVLNVPEALPRFVDPPAGRFLAFGFVGNVFENRGLEVVIRAMALATARGSRVKLRITGPSTTATRQTLESLSEDLGIGHLVSIEGPVPPEQVPEIYSLSNVALVTYDDSDASNDSLPNKLFEAMAAGRCCLTTQAESGNVVAAAHAGVQTSLDVESMAQTIGELAQDRSRVAQMGMNGRLASERDYVWSRQARTAIDSVQDVLLARRSRAARTRRKLSH